MVRKKLSPWTKNNLREIRHTLERYLAIFAIVFLGVAFFSGLVITRDAMVTTLDKYIIDSNMYDYRLLSTLAFDKDDSKHFLDLEGVEAAEGGISIDFLGYLLEMDQVLVLKAHSIGDSIGKLKLDTGKLPENSNEAVVDSLNFSPDSIGNTIVISTDNEEDTIDSFSFKEYKIVGTVRSTEYINAQRGTTNLANGSINAFIYIPENGFDVDYYNEIYLKLEEDGFPYSDEYSSLINEKENIVQVALDETADNRFDGFLEDAYEELAEGEQEYEDGLAEYLSEKEKAKKELDNAYTDLLDGQKEIIDNEQKLLDGEKEIKNGLKEYKKGIKQYEDGLKEYEVTKSNTLRDLENNQKKLDDNRTKVNNGIKQIDDSGVLDQYEQVNKNLEDLNYAKTQIDESGVRATYTRLQDALAEIDDGQKEIDYNLNLVKSGMSAIEGNPEISNELKQHGGLSGAITFYSDAKSQLLAAGGPIDDYSKLDKKLLQLNEIEESTLSEEEKLQLEGEKAIIIDSMNAIEATGVLAQFKAIDLLLDTLYQYESLQASLTTINENQEQLNKQKTEVEAGIAQIENSEYSDLIINYDELLEYLAS